MGRPGAAAACVGCLAVLALRRAVLGSGGAEAAPAVGVGSLVEFATRPGETQLGAVQDADGKRNWKVMTASGSV